MKTVNVFSSLDDLKFGSRLYGCRQCSHLLVSDKFLGHMFLPTAVKFCTSRSRLFLAAALTSLATSRALRGLS